MIWLIGNKGMLGYEVEKLLKERGFTCWATDREVDISDYKALEKFGKDKKIKWIINCSGYTQVDKAEEEIDKAFRINQDGVRNIALFSAKRQIRLIHISTDYVFDGRKEKDEGTVAYREDDKTNPINIYGKSKLVGEEEIKKILKEYFIIRTAWLYGLKGNNFIYTMLRLFKERDVVKVVEDQWGSPTYTVDLAGVILKIIEDDSVSYGIYHFTDEGITSWYEFAKAIYNKAKRLGLVEDNKKIEIQSIKTEDYPTAARRPRYSVLSKEKIKREFNLKVREWDKALEDFLLSLKRERESLESRVEK
jgi:dTDP-4-dehydrorhamnose reductase